VIGIGTRWSDFTTASKTAFQSPEVRFVNVNVAEFDALKLGAVAVTADARATLEALSGIGYRVDPTYRDRCARLANEWDREVSRLYALGHAPLPAQSEVIGAVNEFSGATDVVVCAAGSMPGELHKLWRTRDRKQYHVEYGYSCMGYEIAGALGVKLAAPEREVYALVGDGSYLMLNEAIVTSIQERAKLVVVLVDNHGFASIGGLSRSLGTDGFGTQFRESKAGLRGLDSERNPAPYLPIDLAANAKSLGAHVIRARGIAALRDALAAAKKVERTVVIHVEVDRYIAVPSDESWWEVPVAATSERADVRDARKRYEMAKQKQRRYL
jgi:3D-(3,5/4)-trihydroxycyclohexane-1,2-dione acylhydrolase (decyclizing)